MRKLTKREVETLLDTYDDDPMGALSVAISLTQEEMLDSWSEVVQKAELDENRAHRLREGHTEACDELLKRLVENRSL